MKTTPMFVLAVRVLDTFNGSVERFTLAGYSDASKATMRHAIATMAHVREAYSDTGCAVTFSMLTAR